MLLFKLEVKNTGIYYVIAENHVKAIEKAVTYLSTDAVPLGTVDILSVELLSCGYDVKLTGNLTIFAGKLNNYGQ